MPDPVIHSQRRFGVSLILPALLMLLCGCFVETSYPFGHDDVSWIDRPLADEHSSTRRWLAYCHRELENLLPAGTRSALLSEDFVGEDGGPIKAAEHFKLRFEDMDTMLGNARGLLHTSHLASTCTYVDPPPPAWPGFEDLWIPICDKLQLSGRMALSTDHNGEIAQADCIVILPGFLGALTLLRFAIKG